MPAPKDGEPKIHLPTQPINFHYALAGLSGELIWGHHAETIKTNSDAAEIISSGFDFFH